MSDCIMTGFEFIAVALGASLIGFVGVVVVFAIGRRIGEAIAAKFFGLTGG